MKRIAIVDTETTGLDPVTDSVIELAVVLWDVEHRTTIASFAHLVLAEENPAQEINGIPGALVQKMGAFADPWPVARSLVYHADALVAHNAAFDRAFVAGRLHDGSGAQRPWICSDDDIGWPHKAAGHGLMSMALAHGVPVVSTHRALADCQLIVGMLERCDQRGHDVGGMLDDALEHALLPKFRFVSEAPFDRKDEVKGAGFRWDPARREWWRVMTADEARALAFPTRQGTEA